MRLRAGQERKAEQRKASSSRAGRADNQAIEDGRGGEGVGSVVEVACGVVWCGVVVVAIWRQEQACGWLVWCVWWV